MESATGTTTAKKSGRGLGERFFLLASVMAAMVLVQELFVQWAMTATIVRSTAIIIFLLGLSAASLGASWAWSGRFRARLAVAFFPLLMVFALYARFQVGMLTGAI